MRSRSLFAAVIGVCVASVVIFAQVASKPAEQAASTPAGAASQPASAPVLLATVGVLQITDTDVDRMLPSPPPPNTPKDQIDAYRNEVRNQLIFQELMQRLAASKNIVCTPEDVKAQKEKFAARFAEVAQKNNMSVNAVMAANGITEGTIRMNVLGNKLLSEYVSEPKVAALVKANPAYFDGTVVAAEDLLVPCDLFASTVEQKSALDKIRKIEADIKAARITFEEAAKTVAPQKDKSPRPTGRMAPLRFAETDPQISQALFAMKVGEISKIVRDNAGFHILKVTGRLDGMGEGADLKQFADPQQIAQQCLQSNLQAEIFEQILTTCPLIFPGK